MMDHRHDPVDPGPRQAVLCAVQLPDTSDLLLRESLDELGRLSRTLGLKVVGEVTQRRAAFDPAAYLGAGRLAEVKALVSEDPEGTVVLVDHEITPSQARNLERGTGAHMVLDRTALILEIFHRHARSAKARMQVELLRLAYTAPRLRELGKGADRQRGGIGGKGAGESGLELDRRKIRDRIADLRRQIAALEVGCLTRRQRRQGLRRVALCGYTNAGKSTLFRGLTQSDVYIADKLFATLDTTVRALQPEAHPRILISDTIGFIRNLPARLTESFRTTLDEALEASLILHVVDSADPAWERHMQTTSQVLAEIGAGDLPQLLVFNKADRDVPLEVRESQRAMHPDGILISAKRPEDVARLRGAIIDFFDRDLAEVELLVPYHLQDLRKELYTRSHVLSERSADEGVYFRLRADEKTLFRLRLRLSSGKEPLS